MYPTGVNKYYDMYSFDGFVNFMTSLLWYEACDITGWMFLYGIPLDYLLDAFMTAEGFTFWSLFLVIVVPMASKGSSDHACCFGRL